MRQSERNRSKSTAASWLVVLLLAATIYAIIRGIASFWADEEFDRLPPWLLRIYGINEWGTWQPWHQPIMTAAILMVLLSIGIALFVARKRNHGREAETRALVVGTSAVYLPTLIGSLPALFGLVALMVTPFLSAGVVPLIAQFLPQDMAAWVCRGTLGTWTDNNKGFRRLLTAIAQPIVAIGLAISAVGLVL